MKMKKICLLLPLILLLMFTGCGKKSDVGEEVPARAENAPLISEDFSYGELKRWWTTPLSASENGFYYKNYASGSSLQTIHYCDIRTQKDIILCNKPECRHDGNEFCVATNAKYSPFYMQLYSGRLYIGASCTDGSTISFKLLRASLDGSGLDDVVTFYTYTAPDCTVGTPDMIIHRNKVFAKIQVLQNPDIENTILNGTVVYDLETQELTWLDEQPLSADNPERGNFSACQNYFFYSQMHNRKALLHRYRFSDGTDEAITLRNGFKYGTYIVIDEDTVYYTTDNSNLHLFAYHIGEKRNEALHPTVTLEDGHEKELSRYTLYSDGTYLYFVFYSGVLEGDEDEDQRRLAYGNLHILDYDALKPDYSNMVRKSHVAVFTPDMKLAAEFFNIPDYKELTGKDYVFSDQFRGYSMDFHFTKDTVYLTSRISGGYEEPYVGDYAVYAMSREDLLSGEGTFQPLFNP